MSRLLAARLRSHEAKQKGFILDGCGIEGVNVQHLLELLHAGPEEVTTLARDHSREHCSLKSSHSTKAPTPHEGSSQAATGIAEEAAPPLFPATPRHPPVVGSDEGLAAIIPQNSGSPMPRESPKASVELKASIPPLQLGEIKATSPDLRGQYPLPTASSKGSSSALSATTSPSQAAHEFPKLGLVNDWAPDGELEVTMAPADGPPLLVDLLFVFEPEPDDMVFPDTRLLEEEGQKSDNGAAAPSKRSWCHSQHESPRRQ